MLVEMGESKVSTISQLKSAQDLIEKAHTFKTPNKIKDKHKRVDSFLPIFDYTSMDELTLDFIKETEEYINHIKEVLNGFMNNTEMNNDQIFTSLKMLELEKNKLKWEIGNRDWVVIPEKFDSSSVWNTVSMIGQEFLEAETPLRTKSSLFQL